MRKRVVILGAGISGIGAALLAKKMNLDVFVSDNAKIDKKQREILFNNKIDWEDKGHTFKNIINADEVIKSPGISDKIELIQTLKNNHVPIISEIEFAFRYTKSKVIAVTGSNGKSTTTLLLGHILKKAGLDVLIAGNIGISFSASTLMVFNWYFYVFKFN